MCLSLSDRKALARDRVGAKMIMAEKYFTPTFSFSPLSSTPHPFTLLYHYWFLLFSYIEREGEKFSIALRSGEQCMLLIGQFEEKLK